MNGRLYDPKLHRFLQPDNYIQDPSNTQNYNRYGYCYNNPLKYTDVTGEWFGLDDLIVAAASFVIGYVGSGLSTGNWGWSSVKAGLISAVTGWIAYNTLGASTFSDSCVSGNAGMWNFIGSSAANAVISYFMPPVGIQVGDWSISISPAIAFGNSMGIGANLSVTYSAGDFSFSGGIGIMSNSNYNGLGKSGMEIRKSILASYDDGKNGISLGTNIWSGTGGMEEFSQQTGTLGLHFGDFRAQYENDGKPFSGINADGNDQYRTAALTLSVGEYSAGLNLFSGKRTRADYKIEEKMSGGVLGNSSNGRYGEHYKNGPVNETGPAYRMGAAYFGNTSGIGASLSVTYSSGDFSFSAGVGIMSNSNYNGMGKNGLEIRKSILASYDDGKNGVSLGSNIWSGDFAQTTGVVGLHFGDFRAMYENDGGPVLKQTGLGGGTDSYRTAALNLSVGEFSAGFNLFTGARDQSKDPEKWAVTNSVDGYSRKYTRGYVNETGTKYRLGALTVGYGSYRVGVNSEHVRHAIQDRVIHGMIKDAGFENQSWDWKGYSQYRTSNGFTSW
jgi:hypothetical protein